MNKSESIATLAKALNLFQGELKPVPKESINPFFKHKYADISTIWEASRPLLAKHGFAIAQLPTVENNQIVLTTLLMHISGEWLSSDLLVTPVKLNDPQAVGSALTYARRYALSAILGICSEEDDDAEMVVSRTKKDTPVAKSSMETKQEPGQFANAGEFLTTCSKLPLKMNRTQVLTKLKSLGITIPDNFEGVNFQDAYQILRDNVG